MFFILSVMTNLITLNEKVDDVMKIVKSPKQSLLLTKGVSETNKREEKNTKILISHHFIGYIRS